MTRMAVLSVGAGLAVLALAGCASPDTRETPSQAEPTVYSSDAGPTFAPADLAGFVTDADTPPGLTFDAFWLDAPVAEVAPETVEYFDPSGFDPPACAAQAMAVELVWPADAEPAAAGSIMYWFEYGVITDDVWDTAAQVSARTFESGATAADYLVWAAAGAGDCAAGYAFSADGQEWVVGGVGVDRLESFPAGFDALRMTVDVESQEVVSTILLMRYGNLVVAVRADDSATVAPRADRAEQVGLLVAGLLAEQAARD